MPRRPAHGPQQRQEVGAAPGPGGSEEGEAVVADLGANAVFALVLGAGVVGRAEAAMREH